MAVAKSESLNPTHEAVIETLNTAYQETVSTLKFRIMVTGNHGRHLQQGATLRAEITCASLKWHPCSPCCIRQKLGGGRLALLFQRGRVFNELDSIGLWDAYDAFHIDRAVPLTAVMRRWTLTVPSSTNSGLMPGSHRVELAWIKSLANHAAIDEVAPLSPTGHCEH